MMSHSGTGNARQTYTGTANGYGGRKKGLVKQKVMIEPGVYKMRTCAINLAYHGYDESVEKVENASNVRLTVPEKWLDENTPVSVLKAFFMHHYRKK
jgi:hypothetical protein